MIPDGFYWVSHQASYDIVQLKKGMIFFFGISKPMRLDAFMESWEFVTRISKPSDGLVVMDSRKVN